MRARLDQIGGPNALTIWSWTLTCLLGLVITGVFEGIFRDRITWTWLGLVLTAHLIIAGPMALAHFWVLPATPRPPRPVSALVVFAVLGMVRAVLIEFAARAVGIPASLAWTPRLVVGAALGVLFLSLIAIAVDDYRRFRATAEALRELNESLRERNASHRGALTLLRAQLAKDADAVISEALRGIDTRSQTDPVEVAKELQRVSRTVVRPLSHHLAHEGEVELAAGVDQGDVPRRGRVDRLTVSLAPAGAWLPAIVVCAAFFAESVALDSLGLALLRVLAGGGTLVVGSLLLRRFFRPRLQAWSTLTALAASYLTIGLLAALAAARVTDLAGGRGTWLWPGALVFTVVALADSTRTALIAEAESAEDALVSLNAEQARTAAELHAEVVAIRLQVAKVLHGAVQGELLAEALRSMRERRVAPDLIDGVRARVTELLFEYARPERSAQQRLTDLIDVWHGALAVDLHVSPAALEVLESQPGVLEACLDVVSEGLGNALRHGVGESTSVNVDSTAGSVRVEITSVGAKPLGRASAGLGMRLIEVAATKWTLTSDGGKTTLVAILA